MSAESAYIWGADTWQSNPFGKDVHIEEID